ncbi:MAG TPA: glycosyltransferase [Lacunisphaera sp.]|nr:glycosyltransferase [Lacunisphaera sp.]
MIETTPARVLIGVTTRNRASILPKAVASALAQDYPSFEVAVVDDASTDATPDLRACFPAVAWLRHETAQGYMANRNELMRRAGFAYYVSLDDDAWFLHRDEISLAVSRLEAEPGVAGVAFDILSPDRPDALERSGPRRVAMFIGCGHVLRLSAVREAGYYAPCPGLYGSEEKDLCLRLADLGYEIELLPGVHVWHDKAWTGRDWSPLHRSGVCNEMIMTLRRCPLPDVLLVLPLKVVSYLWFWLRNPRFFPPGLAGLALFARNLGATWRSRAPVRRGTFWRFKRGAPPAPAHGA